MSRIPLRGIGRPDPPSVAAGPIAQQLMGAVSQGGNSLPMINPELLAGAPPWAVFLMNQVQNGLAEISAIKLALMRRGLLTEPELMEALLEISRAYEAQFRSMANDIDRVMNQRPTQAQDPRQGPK